MKINTRSFLQYVSFLVIMLFPILVVTLRRSWLDASQIALHLPLVVAVWVIVKGRLSAVPFAVSILVAVLLADFGIIDDYLYLFLSDKHLFPAFVTHDGFVNPQYTKLILYSIVILILAFQTILSRSRTPERFFVVLSCLSCLLVTFAIHREIPGQHLAWARKLSIQNMEFIVDFADKNPSLSNQVCVHFKLRCLMDVGLPTLLDEIDDNKARENTSKEVLEQKKRVVETGVFDHGHWRRLIIGSQSKGDGRYNFFLESDVINKSQSLSEDSFGRLATMANLIWGWLMVLLGMFHKSAYREKLFTYDDQNINS